MHRKYTEYTKHTMSAHFAVRQFVGEHCEDGQTARSLPRS